MSCCVFIMQWFGDAEKLTKSLFSLARKLSPAVIFVDEVGEFYSFSNHHYSSFMVAYNGFKLWS